MPDSFLAFLAAVHRMRVVQKLRDQQPGPPMRLKVACVEAEADVDVQLERLYITDPHATPLEGQTS